MLSIVHDLNEWFPLGLKLGLHYPTLERIEKEQREKILDCKRKMMVAWLNGQDNSQGPSWNVLRNALLSIGKKSIAIRIICN